MAFWCLHHNIIYFVWQYVHVCAICSWYIPFPSTRLTKLGLHLRSGHLYEQDQLGCILLGAGLWICEFTRMPWNLCGSLCRRPWEAPNQRNWGHVYLFVWLSMYIVIVILLYMYFTLCQTLSSDYTINAAWLISYTWGRILNNFVCDQQAQLKVWHHHF